MENSYQCETVASVDIVSWTGTIMHCLLVSDKTPHIMFDADHDAETERGVLVSGDSYTVDISYGVWLPLIFFLGKKAIKKKQILTSTRS